MAQTTRRESREQAFALVFEMIFNDAPVEELVEGAAQCRDISIGDYALEAAKAEGIHGKDTTPFLLAHIKDYTKGVSLASNLQLAYNNARMAAKIAIAYSKLG